MQRHHFSCICMCLHTVFCASTLHWSAVFSRSAYAAMTRAYVFGAKATRGTNFRALSHHPKLRRSGPRKGGVR